MEVDFEKLVGKRILVDTFPQGTCEDQYIEYNVIDVSPAGKFVKLEDANNGGQCWKEFDTVCVLEILREIRF